MEKKKMIVKYVGNGEGKTQTPEWIGTIFEVMDYTKQSYTATRIVEKGERFRHDSPFMPSFYKYNTVILSSDVNNISDNLFVWEWE